MTICDFAVSKALSEHYSFDALIMAAIRKADPQQFALLTKSAPQVWWEMVERARDAGGLTLSERSWIERRDAAIRTREEQS